MRRRKSKFQTHIFLTTTKNKKNLHDVTRKLLFLGSVFIELFLYYVIKQYTSKQLLERDAHTHTHIGKEAQIKMEQKSRINRSNIYREFGCFTLKEFLF